ncbi:MAG: biopolymer transporter ExbD [Hahellaceae bacterium]|nr:biopolymer transporter ExbD [Hahellaceae bacterium]
MKRFDQINMIPFIDVMLVLMAVVMTTASFVKIGLIDVNLPVAQQVDSPASQDNYIEIGINDKNEFFYNGEKTTLDDLEGRLQTADKRTPIQMRVDKAAVFDAFIGVITTLKHHQFDNISIETLSDRP